MKKAGLLACACLVAQSLMAQTIPNGGFESWRVSSAGSTTATAKIVRAPYLWYGVDSLIIANGQTIGLALGISPTVWQQQLFKDSTTVHGGTYSAKLVTADQDTLGIFPGILSNSQAHVSVSLSGLGPITFTGGMSIGGTNVPATVSAWVKYTPAATTDTGSLTVQAYKRIGSVDSLIGLGFANIVSNTAYTQVTAPMIYTLASMVPDTIRINFASSKNTSRSAVGSTLWVDDVTMTSTPVALSNVEKQNAVSLFPNPATQCLNINAPAEQAFVCTLHSMTGAIAATYTGKGMATFAVNNLPAGSYYYTVTTLTGELLHNGMLSLMGN
ncbi:MAG: T9SS C-terminal target domain-containing protein [Chitinophagia bacterium]|nr:T9SS C-terminal target domain-containing protein [Chitinophagia bacterium]